MARSRNIKPALFTNDELSDNDPLGRLLFIGMWTIADYNGNFIWKPRRVKAQLLPYDNCDIEKLAINLDQSGFIRFYSDQENIYCSVVNFKAHQNPHKNEKEKGASIPEYSEAMRQAVDLKGLTINRDKSGLIPEDSASDPADSLILIPDSPSLIPEPLNRKKQSAPIAAVDFSIFNLSISDLEEVKRIRIANKGGAIKTQRVANGLATEIKKALGMGLSIDTILTEWETRKWKSFKADWMGNSRQGYAQAGKADRAAQLEQMDIEAGHGRVIEGMCQADSNLLLGNQG